MSDWRKKEEDEVGEVTEERREFHNKTVDGKKESSRRDFEQTGKAKDFGLRKEQFDPADIAQGTLSSRAGGPSPLSSNQRQSSF